MKDERYIMIHYVLVKALLETQNITVREISVVPVIKQVHHERMESPD